MKKTSLLLSVLAASFLAIAQEGAPSIRDLKSGRFQADSSYIYALPYPTGQAHLLAQAYQSNLSHKGEFVLDFKMKPGSTVCAARAGVVLATREDSDQGGLKPEMLSEANYIIIGHEDGSQAHYWHLQHEGVFVREGDTVGQGQPIGRSGHTGYSAFPHLHFEVTKGTATGTGQLPTRFHTRQGSRYLRPGKWYRAVAAR